MPAIPTIASPQLAPPPEISPGIAGQPGQAISNAADQFASVADMGVQVANKVKQAQDDGILLNAENQIGSDIEKARTGLANWTDYTHADQLKQNTADSLREKYVDQYGNRPDLWRVIAPYLGKALNSYNVVVDNKSADLTADFNKSALMTSNNNTISDAATEPALDGKEMHWAVADAKIDAMVRNGSIWKSEGEAEKQRLRGQTIATEVERAANPLNAPEIMQAEMARLKEYEGKNYVPAKELAEYQAHLCEAYKVASRNFDEKAIAKQGDAVITSLTKDPTVKDAVTGDVDYLKAAKKVDEDSSIPTNVKKYVREEFEQRDTVQKRITNESNQKILDQEVPRLYDTKNPLTSAEVKQRALLAPSQPGYLPREVESHLLTSLGQIQRENRAQDIAERGEIRQERLDKSRDMAYDLLQNLGPLTSKSDLTPYILKGLTREDAEAVWQAKDLSKDKGWGLAVQMLNTSPLYDHNTDEGRAKLAKDTLDFAKTVQNKKLMGSQITQELQNELHPQEEAKKKQDVGTLLDNVLSPASGLSVPVRSPLPSGGKAPERPNGVPDNAVWNGEARQWQLPRQ
jgi:hypothetical protein